MRAHGYRRSSYSSSFIAGGANVDFSVPTFHIPPDLDMHYLIDGYTDPWGTPATMLMLHGNAASSASW